MHGAPRCNRLAGFLIAFTILIGSIHSPAIAQDKSLTVFCRRFDEERARRHRPPPTTAKTGIKITASYAASPALAKQIEQGAPADIFASADTDWMDYAIAKKTINEPTRVNLLRQQHRADRTEGLQDRPVSRSDQASISQNSSATARLRPLT